MMKWLGVFFLVLTGLVEANGQYIPPNRPAYVTPPRPRGYPYPYPYAYPPGYAAPYYGRGGVLSGHADVINARGNTQVQAAEAARTNQETQSMIIDNRRKAFDERMYEASRTPTPEQRRELGLIENERRIQNDLRESLNEPSTATIVSGSALNQLLPTLKDVSNSGFVGPEVFLDPEILKQINVTVTTGDISYLKNPKNLNWPLSLRGDTQRRLDGFLVQAVENAKSDKMDRELLAAIDQDLDSLKANLSKGVSDGRIDLQEYSEAATFLRGIVEGVRILRKPDAGRYFDGSFQAKGETVQELVRNMNNKGLKFAAAKPGQESYYIALHSQMVGYAKTCLSGFRLRLGVPVASSPK